MNSTMILLLSAAVILQAVILYSTMRGEREAREARMLITLVMDNPAWMNYPGYLKKGGRGVTGMGIREHHSLAEAEGADPRGEQSGQPRTLHSSSR